MNLLITKIAHKLGFHAWACSHDRHELTWILIGKWAMCEHCGYQWEEEEEHERHH